MLTAGLRPRKGVGSAARIGDICSASMCVCGRWKEVHHAERWSRLRMSSTARPWQRMQGPAFLSVPSAVCHT